MKIFLNKKQVPLLVLFILLVLTDIAGLVLIKNTQAKLADSQRSLFWQEELQKENIPSTILKETGKIEEVFPNEQGVMQFISYLNSFKDQFEKFSLNFESEEAKGTKLKYLPLVLEISGNYQSINDFLDKLWKAPFVLEVTSLDLKKQPESDKTAMTLKTNLYVQEVFESK